MASARQTIGISITGSFSRALGVQIEPFCDFFDVGEISVLIELTLGHLRYCLTDVPPQPNSPPDNVFHVDRSLKTA